MAGSNFGSLSMPANSPMMSLGSNFGVFVVFFACWLLLPAFKRKDGGRR